MLDFLLGVNLVFGSQILDDVDIQPLLHNEAAGPGRLRILPLPVHGIGDRQAVFAACHVVVLAKGGRRVDDARTVCRRHIIAERHIERLFIHADERHQLLVFHIFEIPAFDGFHHRVRTDRSEHGFGQLFRDVQVFPVLLCLDVVYLCAHGERDVRRKRPGRRRPGEEVRVLLSLFTEATCDRIALDLFISLCNFVGSKSGTTAGTVRQDLVTFVDEPAVEELLEQPPDGLDVVVFQRDIGIIHIDEIPHAFRHFAPRFFVRKHRFPALLVKLADAVRFDIFFARHTQLFFHFDLDRQAVRVPARFPANLESLHRLVATHGILERPGHDVVNARHTVCRRRPFVEYKRRPAFTDCDAFFQEILLFPGIGLRILDFSDGFIRQIAKHDSFLYKFS